MGTFAETANIDYRSSFADQGKQTSIFVPIFRIYIYTYIYIYIHIYRHKHINIYTRTYIYKYLQIYCIYMFFYIYICCRFKRKTEAQAIFLNPFFCSSCKRNFVVYPFVYKETNGSYPFANGLQGLAHLWMKGTFI